MNKNPIIAVAAIKYFDIVKNHNLYKIKEFIKKAKKRNADIVCFPESCITKSGSIPLKGRFIKDICTEFKKNSIWGIITEDIIRGKKTYNTSLLIDRKGKIRGYYDKIHLYGDNVSAGHRVKVFKTDFGRIGIATCWDLSYPHLFNKMKEKNAEIVFCPSQWNYDVVSHKNFHKSREIKILKAMLLARAHENVFYIAICNPLIKAKTQVSYSAIAEPHRILKELINKEGLITARTNMDKLKKFREYYHKE